MGVSTVDRTQRKTLDVACEPDYVEPPNPPRRMPRSMTALEAVICEIVEETLK